MTLNPSISSTPSGWTTSPVRRSGCQSPDVFDLPTHLHTITAPVLFLQGTAEPLLVQQSHRYLPFIPGARLRWLPGANHVPISDDPSAVAAHMLAFLNRAPRAPMTTSDTRRVQAAPGLSAAKGKR